MRSRRRERPGLLTWPEGSGLGLDIVPCAAEAGASPLPARELRRLPVEAFLLHWYAVGRGFATLTRNRAMLRRIR